MPKYLLEVTYTTEGIKGVKKEGGSARVAAATAVVESTGGKVESFYFALGESDAYVIVEFPEATAAAAAALTVNTAGGAKIKTVSLLTAAEVDAAAKVETRYRAPGA